MEQAGGSYQGCFHLYAGGISLSEREYLVWSLILFYFFPCVGDGIQNSLYEANSTS